MPQQQSKPAAFIHKLCNILRSKEHAKIIHWDTQLKGIRILNQKKLEERILPRYYRHNRFSSFVRQLNMYDFHKVHLPDHRYIFRHQDFDPKRYHSPYTRKEQIHLIRRKVSFDHKSSQNQAPSYRQFFPSRRQNQALDTFLKSSKNMLLKSFIFPGSERNQQNQQISKQKALEELQRELQQIKQNKQQLKNRIKELKKQRKYRSHIKNTSFMKTLYEKMQIQYEDEEDDLSQLSIQEQLLFKTKRSLDHKSLKLVESGQLFFRKDNTIRNLFNL